MNLDKHDQRAAFRTTSLLTTEKEATQVTELAGLKCRVCDGYVRAGDMIRTRQWHVEISHSSCGWLRLPEEHDIHERTRPGTFFSYFEWRCPACGLDACATRRPRDDDDPRCRRCRPCAELGPGALAELISSVTVRGVFRSALRLDPYHRVRVREVLPDRVVVESVDTPAGLVFAVRALSLTTL